MIKPKTLIIKIRARVRESSISTELLTPISTLRMVSGKSASVQARLTHVTLQPHGLCQERLT